MAPRLLNRCYVLLSGLLLAGFACLATGCQGDSAGTHPESLAATAGAPASGAAAGGPAGLPGLPPLPTVPAPAHQPSYSNVVYYQGNAIFDSSPGCVFTSDAIIVPAAAGALEYALYAFNTNGYNPNKLELGLSVSDNATAWVGVSDYFANRWEFHGPYTGAASINLNSPKYLSGTGQMYVLVAAYNGATVTSNYLALTYDNAIAAEFSISGTVLDEHGAPLGGIRVSANPDFTEVQTDAQGHYYLPVSAAGLFSASASSFDNFDFAPANQDVTVDGHETGVDFTASRVDVFGRITTSEGAGVTGVQLTLNPGAKQALSGADGRYAFHNVSVGNYTIEPVLAGYIFEPVGLNISVAMSDYNGANFTATGGQPTYAMRGNVALGDTTPVPGVVLLLNPGNRVAQTDASGNYAFYSLGNGTYTLTPGLGFYTFAPVSRTVIIDNASENGVDFTATPPPPQYTVSGVLTDSDYGDPLPGVQVQVFESGELIKTAYTDIAGFYSFSVPDGTYLVYGFKNYYEMSSPFVTVTGADETLNLTGHMPGGATWDSFANAFINNNCIQCHRPDSISAVDPPLRNYDEAKTNGSLSNFKVQNGTMPPDWSVPTVYKKYFQEWKDNSYPEN